MKIECRSHAEKLIEGGEGCIFDPNTMDRYENHYIRTLRAHCKRPNLHTYFHKVTGRHILFTWLVAPNEGHPTGLMLELEGWRTYEEAPHHNWLKRRLQPVNPFVQEAMASQEEASLKPRRDAAIIHEKQKDLTRFAKSKGMEDTARRLTEGTFPLSTKDTF